MNNLDRIAGVELEDVLGAATAIEKLAPSSLADQVYRQLRGLLMAGHFRPHQRLKVRDLARALGTSETPVREAIFQLVRDGALDLKPRHYIRVRRLGLIEYFELRDIRLQLEPLAAARALPNFDADMIDALAEVHAELIAAEKADDYKAAVQLNFDFHFGIYWRSEMPALINMLETLWVQVGPLLNDLYPHGPPTYPGRHQHEEVLAALRSGDADALRQAISQDMIQGGRKFVRYLERVEQEGEQSHGR